MWDSKAPCLPILATKVTRKDGAWDFVKRLRSIESYQLLLLLLEYRGAVLASQNDVL
jgi:hypothetical protein